MSDQYFKAKLNDELIAYWSGKKSYKKLWSQVERFLRGHHITCRSEQKVQKRINTRYYSCLIVQPMGYFTHTEKRSMIVLVVGKLSGCFHMFAQHQITSSLTFCNSSTQNDITVLKITLHHLEQLTLSDC